MEKTRKATFPRWLFGILAMGGLLASGIYLGIMMSEGFGGMQIAKAIGFGGMGIIMAWGTFARS
ncbi:MAG: hypothetical protein ABIJ65_09940 [Chloroflexota bacterium]